MLNGSGPNSITKALRRLNDLNCIRDWSVDFLIQACTIGQMIGLSKYKLLKKFYYLCS